MERLERHLRSSSILALDGIFIWNICMVELGHMSLSLNLGEIGPVVTEVYHFLYLRSSFIGGRLIWNAFIVYFGHMSLSLKLRNIGPVVAAIFHFWYLRSSSIICIIGGRLYLWHFSFVWSQKLKFKFWGRLDQWLLRYSIFNIWGLLPLFHWRSSSSEILL